MQIAVVLLFVALRYILNVIRLCESHELHMTFGPPPPYGLQLLQFSVLNIYHHVTFTAGEHAILQNFYHLLAIVLLQDHYNHLM